MELFLTVSLRLWDLALRWYFVSLVQGVKIWRVIQIKLSRLVQESVRMITFYKKATITNISHHKQLA